MKKILLITVLFIAFLGNAQISKRQVPKITSEMIDPTYASTIESSGGLSNPNITVVLNQSQITSVGANAFIEIQGNIVLNSNYTPPANQTWLFSTGNLDLNGYTLNRNNTTFIFSENQKPINAYTGTITGTGEMPPIFSIENIGGKDGGSIVMNDFNITSGTKALTSTTFNFTANDVGKVVAIVGAGGSGTVLKTTITAYTNSKSVTVNNNAVSTVTNANGTVSWDNQTAVRNALALLNASGGSSLTGNNKTYYHSTVALEAQDYNDPTNWTIKGDNHTLKNVSFQLIPHDLSQTETLVVDKATNTTLENVKLYGDRLIHGTEGIGKTEGNHGFVWRTLAKNTIMTNCTAANFYGDGGIARGDMQFTNYIDGSAGVTGTTESTIAAGSINNDGLTIDTGNTSKAYTVNFIDIDKAQFTNQIQTGYPNKSYKLGGRSNAGWGSLRTPYYRAFYYNEAKTTLLYSSPIQYIYDEIPLKEEWKFVRFEFDYPIDITLVELMASPQLVANGLNWTGGEIYGNGRDGVSNPPDNATFDGIYFHDNGYLVAGPNYNFNAEDRRRYCRNLTIQNCKFRDAFGDIKLVGTENVLIKNNIFLPHTKQILAIERDYEYFGLDISYGRGVIAEGNIVYERSSGFDRGDFVHGNRFIGGRVVFSANNNIFKDNYCVNILFKGDNDTDVSRVGYPSILENNKFIYNRTIPNSTYLFIDANKTMSFINNEFRFNDISQFSFDATQTNFMVFDDGGINRIFQNTTPTLDYGGVWNGNKFFGASAESDYETGYMTPPLKDFNNNTIEASVSFKNDIVGSYTTKNNTIKGFLYLELDSYPATVTGAPETIRFENLNVIIDDKFDWTNTGAAIYKTETRYVNVEFYNCTFDIQIASTDTGTFKKWMRIKTLGTTLFEGCTFKSKTAKDWTMTDYDVGVGSIILKNTKEFVNITTTTRSIDKLLYSTPNPNCPTYASNALAVAALGVGWYYKDSADSNKFKITY